MKSKAFGCLLLVVALIAASSIGCSSPNKGSREFIPGKGWEPVD